MDKRLKKSGLDQIISSFINVTGQLLSETNYIFITIFIIFLITVLFISQFYFLLKIKKILNQLYQYSEHFFRIFTKSGKSLHYSGDQKPVPETCQFCKHRLSYIHMSDGENIKEDFYYKCRIYNIPINLNDHCDRFETEG